MARIFGVLVGVVLGVSVMFVLNGIMWNTHRAPEEIVQRSLDALRAGDLGTVRRCYTDEAWTVIAPTFPEAGDRPGKARLKRFMDGFKSIQVEAASYRDGHAVVEAVIDHEQGEQREIFELVQAGDSWLID